MNKGYSLIELLGVFVVLAILSIIAFPIISDTIKEITESGKLSQEKLVIEAAKGWVSEHTSLLSDEVGSTYEVDIPTLKEGNYISQEKIKNLSNKQEYQNACVKITTLEHKYSYEFDYEC